LGELHGKRLSAAAAAMIHVSIKTNIAMLPQTSLQLLQARWVQLLKPTLKSSSPLAFPSRLTK
jgi:hypothetical protein